MNITFNRLTLSNFKSHAALTVDFGDITRIEGTNGAGKSSIGDSITWALYGTDSLGTKLDPTPIIGASSVKAELLLTVDEKQFLLCREITSGKNKFYINEIPSKATEYNALVESLFNKDLFLSLFNPSYFFTQHWETQRGQLLSYVSDPTNKEVLDQLTPVHRERLGEALKKHSLDDLDKKHRDNKNRTGKEYERMRGVLQAHEQAHQQAVAQTETLTLDPDITIDDLYEKANKLQFEIDGHSGQIRAQQEWDRKFTQLEARLQSTEKDAATKKETYMRAKDNPNYAESCGACGRPHTEETLEINKQHWQGVLEGALGAAKTAIAEYKSIKEQYEVHKATPRPVVPDISELNKNLRETGDMINILKAATKTASQLEESRTKLQEVARSLSESEFMVDYIKDFRAKRAEITAQKVSGLFATLSVRLYNATKEGDQKPTFEIEMNSVPYSKLSTAEKIKAGLELIGVLTVQANVVTPVFVDNAESILRFGKPSGQLILARVQDSELTITTEKLQMEGVAVNG